MISCPHGLGTVRTGVRPLMSSMRSEAGVRCGCKERTGPGSGRAAICSARYRHGTPDSAHGTANGRFLAAHESVTHTKESTVHHPTSTHRTLGVVAALLVTACSGGDGARGDSAGAATASAETPAPCTTGTAELTLPAGFCATVFADSQTKPRHVAVASNGDVYATIEGTRPSPEKQISGADKAPDRKSVV